MGIIFDEGTKRIKRTVGLSSEPNLVQYVHPGLRDNALIASKLIQNFGSNVNDLLIKYNKNVVHQQFLLKRLADAVNDIYSMIVVLSRASRALKLNLSSAQHEANMTNVICDQVINSI